MVAKRVLLPAETGVDAADLKAVATTQYETGATDVDKFWVFKYVMAIDNTGGGAAGDAKITVQNLAPGGTTVIDSLDIVTAIDTKADGTMVLVFGGGVNADLTGPGTLSSDADIMKVFYRMNVILEVVTANDGTTSTATSHFLMEG